MNQNDRQNNLLEVIAQLQEAATHLRISLERCTAIGLVVKDENALIEFEAFTSRFARAVDLLIHKVYRSIDNVEFIEGGTLIDVMNRAEKRKLIDSTREMRLLKDMRNDIAHAYLAERLQLLHEEVLNQAPRLLELIQKSIDYCQRLFC